MKYSDKSIYLAKKGQKPTGAMRFKKIGAGVLSATVCMTSVLSAVPTYALTDPDNRATYLEFTFDGSDPMKASDNETTAATNTTMGTNWADSTTISGFSGINSEIHKNVYKIGASDTLDFGVYGTINLPGKKMDAKPHIVSFEFFPMQDNVQYITQMMATSNNVEVLFTIGSNGYCGFSKAGGWNGSNPTTTGTTFAAAPYKVGQWNTIDIVIDPETRVRKYYINGEFCGDNTGSEKYTGLLTFMSFATGKTSIDGKIDPANSGVLFDNVSVNYLNESSFYSRPTVTDGNKIKIDFSETPTEELKDIKLLDSVTGETFSVSDVKSCGKTLTFKVNGSVDPSRQFVLVYPEGFSSVGGHKISDRYLYFYPEEKTGAYVKYASVTDFFGNESGGYETVSVVQDTLKVKFDGPVGSLDISNATINLTESETGNSVSISDIAASDGAVTAKIDRFLSKDKVYVLTVNGIKSNGDEIPEYKTRFFTDNEEVDGFFPVNFKDASGNELSTPKVGTIYADTKFLNTSTEDKSAMITIAGYKNTDNGPELTHVCTKKVDIPAGVLTKVEKDTNELSLEVIFGKKPDFIKGFVWVSGTDKTPHIDASLIGDNNYTVSNIEIGARQGEGCSVTGAAKMAKAESAVSVAVTKKGGTYGDDVVYADQLMTDTEGKVCVAFNVNSAVVSGDYTAEFTCDGESVKYDFVFVNPTEFAALITELKSAESVDDVAEILENNYAKLGISDELYSSVDKEQAAKILYNDVKNNHINDEMTKEISRVKQLFYISAAAKGSLDNVFDYKTELKLDEQESSEWYKKSFVKEKVQKDITARLKKKTGTYDSDKAFYDKLEEAYVLAVVTNPDGDANLKSVLNHFATDIGIKQDGKSTTYTQLNGDVYEDYSALKSAFNTLENKGGEKGDFLGGSSSGGRGNGGIFNGSTVEKEYENNKEEESAQPILKSIFDDLQGFEWAEQPIVYLAEKRIITGKESTKFCPADSVTREEFAAMLVRAFASDAEESTVSFTDTKADEWYIQSLAKAISAGIVKGNEDGSFGIGEEISRQDMVVMLSRALDYSSIVLEAEKDRVDFNDDDDIADYAKDSVYAMKSAGIVNGITKDTFAPLQSANRAEAAKVIFSVLNI